MVSANLRRLVAFSFVALYVFVGIPLWYKLTTIYRAPLPADYIESLATRLHNDIHLSIPVYIRSDVYNFPDICDAVQVQVDELIKTVPEDQRRLQWSLQVLPYKDGEVDPEINYVVTLVLDEFMGLTMSQQAKETIVFFNDESVVNNDLPFFIAQALVEFTFRMEWESFDLSKNGNDSERDAAFKNMAISYNPNIHISISLLTGDGHPIAWDIENSLQKHFTPIRDLLSPLVNFTVDTGIEYHNDLNLHALANNEFVTYNDLSHSLDLSELSFVSHYQEQKSINLAIVFPSLSTGPLKFINESSVGTSWQSFLVPQWGVVVLNKTPLKENSFITEEYLSKVLSTFSKDLLKLFGLIHSSQELTSPLIVISSFKRKVTIDNLEKSINTLSSLVNMTNELKQMSIPKQVLEDVNRALDLRLQIIDLLNNPQLGDDYVWDHALRLSNDLVAICERAFFHKEMVQQIFFPQEHKIAVYLPLLGPITVVTFTGFLKCLRESKKDKKRESEDSKSPDSNREKSD